MLLHLLTPHALVPHMVGRKLCVELEGFLREVYEGRPPEAKTSYGLTSVMAEAFARECGKLLKQKRRPLCFADTAHEAEHLIAVLNQKGVRARTWSDVASENVASSSSAASKGGGKGKGGGGYDVIVASKSTEGQGINMQGHADAIVCRPTPGDHLEQMKGRVDRPGQTSKELILVVLMAEHTLEEVATAALIVEGCCLCPRLLSLSLSHT